MAVAVLNRLQISRKQYRSVMEDLDLERQPSEALAHVAYFEDDGLRVLDVWRSEADWERFRDERLAPTLERLKITAKPDTEMYEVHNVYTPRGDELTRAGRSPHPTAE